jgi:hypothetical protein
MGKANMSPLQTVVHGLAAALLIMPFAIAEPAIAQQPTPEQAAAIRAACRADFMSHCAGVQPGGREALQCLQRNATRLSTDCNAAITALAPKPDAPQGATAAPPPAAPRAQTAQDQLAEVGKVCTISDLAAHCSWIAPNNPELLLCLKANASQLSPACQTAVLGLAAAAPTTAAPTAAAPATATPEPRVAPAPHTTSTPSAAAAPKQPTQQQISAIRAACRSDFMSHCAGVQPGGREALQCLQHNRAQVSQPCQTALAAVGGAEGAGRPSASVPAAVPPPAPAEPLKLRRLRPGEEIAILRMCAADRRTLCGGVQPGGGRIVRCLARNAAQLSPQCRAALADAGG